MSANVFRVLQDSQEIIQARKLLHKVYIEELGWKLTSDNPTGLHVRQLASGEKMLCDHFDDEAVWIGTFKDQELAGVSRILTRENKLGVLDVELYESSKKLPTLVKLKGPCIEMQRLATLKQHRESNFFVDVVSFNLNFAKNKGANIIGATSSKHANRLLGKLGFECLDESFFYGEEDELPVSVYCLSCHEIDDAIRKMEALEYSVEDSTQLEPGSLEGKWF